MGTLLIEEVVKIPQSVIDDMNEFLDMPDTSETFKNGSTYWTLTHKFADGYEADIKVVSGDSPYVDPVLFNSEGHEICAGDVSDKLDGTYIWYDDEKTYTLHVKPV